MTSRILVTGGAGFIGSHLCKKLLSEGNTVFCLDNLFTGSKDNISDLLSDENFHFICFDVEDKIEIDVQYIYNLACPASPVHYQYDPIKTLKTSIFGIINMLELARDNNAVILQASTSEVYGDPLCHPQKEAYWGNVNPVGVRSCYDEGKRCAETFVFEYSRKFNLNSRIVRIFNTYGPNMNINDGRVVSNFIVQALQNKDITVFGDGSQTRSFCYVDDLVNALVLMMNNSLNFKGPVNLGNPCERTVLELAEQIIKLTNSNSKIIFKDLPKDDPIKRRPDITLAKEKLNWEPCVDINDGLAKTISYFKSKLAEINK